MTKLLDGRREMQVQPTRRLQSASNAGAFSQCALGLLLALLLCGCATHKPVERRDLQPPAPYCEHGVCKNEGEGK